MKTVYDKYIKDIPLATLTKVIDEFHQYIFTRNETVIEWLVSSHVGSHVITFRTSDETRLFYELNIDPVGMKSDIIKTLEPGLDWKVITNPINILLILIGYRFKNSETTFRKTIALLYFRFTTSAYSLYFPSPVSPAMAQSIYINTGAQALIKQHGTNIGIIDHITQKAFKNPTLVNKFSSPLIGNISYLLSDISGTARNQCKLTYNVLQKTESVSHSESSSFHSGEKDETLQISHDEYKELTSSLVELDNNNSLYRPRVAKLLASVYSTSLSVEMLEEAVTILVEYKGEDKDKFYGDLVTAFIFYLSKSNYYPPYDKSFMNYVNTARGYINSSKTTDEALLDAKLFIIENITPKMKVKRTAILASNSLLIYCFTMAVYRDRL